MTTAQGIYQEITLQLLRRVAPESVCLNQVYTAVEEAVTFDDGDLKPPMLHGEHVREPGWKRNVRNALQTMKDSWDVVNSAHDQWRLPTPNLDTELDAGQAWHKVLARAVRETNTEFDSVSQGARYKISDIVPSKITIARLDADKSETISASEVEKAIGRLNAAGGVLGRRTIHYTVAKETAIVFLHPDLEWDRAGDQIRVVEGQRNFRTWAFACNPDYYDVGRAIHELAEDSWTVKESDVRAGDRFAIWQNKASGQSRGIVSLGVVLSDPEELPESEESKRFWKGTELPEISRRVLIRYVTRPGLPIWLENDETGLLSELSVSRAAGGTVFHITPDQWQRLEKLCEWPDSADIPPPIEHASEGLIKLRQHKVRERNPRLAQAKKDLSLKATGSLACEVCDFDFRKTYGELGDGFIECHHGVPLADLKPGTITRLSDLHLVCANCHRMLHRNGTIRVSALRALLQELTGDMGGQ